MDCALLAQKMGKLEIRHNGFLCFAGTLHRKNGLLKTWENLKI
jgi:hypothetical protein